MLQAPQLLDHVRHLHTSCVFHSVDRAGLVGDRADATYPGGYVRNLGESPSLEERLVEARRLEDLELQVDDVLVGASPDATVAYMLAIADVNEPPLVAVTNLVVLPEDTDTSTRVKVGDIAVTDDTLTLILDAARIAAALTHKEAA